jgi:hypothetical protein
VAVLGIGDLTGRRRKEVLVELALEKFVAVFRGFWEVWNNLEGYQNCVRFGDIKLSRYGSKQARPNGID